ncbi:unnamed protein product [Diamesa serratosioi]
MDNLMNEPLVENFLKHSGKIMEFGFAYIYAHPEHIAEMKSLLKVIEDMQAVQARHDTVPKLCEQIIINGYIDYIRRVTKFGFKYICNHPEAMKDVQELALIYDELEQLNKPKQPAAASDYDCYDEYDIFEEGGDQFFEECFNELNELQSTIQSFESKIDKKFRSNYPAFATTSRVLKNFNRKLVNKLRKLQHRPAVSKSRTSDVIFVPNNTPATQQRHSNDNHQNANSSFHDKEDTCTGFSKVLEDLNNQLKSSTKINDQTLPECFSVSSGSSSVEHVVESVNFDGSSHGIYIAKSSTMVPTFKVLPPEKYIYIPIETHNNDKQHFPIITTELTFTKPNQCDQISMNLKLGFNDRFQLQDKFINEINIHHKLPFPPRYTLINHDIKLQN